jgi:hypothetical protein
MSKKLQDALLLCRVYGVKRLKTADFEIELGPEAPVTSPPSPEFVPTVAKATTTDILKALADEMPSDIELLKASSPYEDEAAE